MKAILSTIRGAQRRNDSMESLYGEEQALENEFDIILANPNITNKQKENQLNDKLEEIGDAQVSMEKLMQEIDAMRI